MKTANEMRKIMEKAQEKALAERAEKARKFVEETLELKFLEEANKKMSCTVIEVAREIADDVVRILTDNGYEVSRTNTAIGNAEKYLVCWAR